MEKERKGYRSREEHMVRSVAQSQEPQQEARTERKLGWKWKMELEWGGEEIVGRREWEEAHSSELRKAGDRDIDLEMDRLRTVLVMPMQ